ncbi:protein MoeA [Gracilibacillus halophilus YIM-C55.5]|uniref:Molybdopterin molybdenumtransferase n=1 Tax=Gracilibacillus halophilus YIM-C55.5 TaxID=1308866 RepID=N4W6T1_9BACI|nr:gephyrin-like molybdotransferase Glp [Gracilibacillus halophilus]ENH95933.1 protein MoeA [Gracilibacillus halophilus YIM-C55.5]
MKRERQPIPVFDALQRVMKYEKKGPIEYVPIEEAYRRILGKDIVADHDVPAFDRSPYDGYAIRACDTNGAAEQTPITLEVVGHIGAGSRYEKELKANQAVRIMTGAELPIGADAVIMLEDTEVHESTQTYVDIKRTLHSEQNISFQGEDIAKGDVLLERGTRLHPGMIALLATFGYAQVPVVKQPIVGIIATGNELLEVDQPLEPGKIRNSNAYTLIAQVKRAGGLPIYFGQLSDQVDSSVERIREAMNQVDFFITTGGVSVGDFDLLPDILEAIQADVLFNKIAMRPGSVTTVAHANDTLIFGLSGNPSACYVGFELYLRPVIDQFLQKHQFGLPKSKARLAVDFPKANPFDRFVRGFVKVNDTRYMVEPAGKDKSNMVHSLSAANCLIYLPGGTQGYQKGDVVDIFMLDSEMIS